MDYAKYHFYMALFGFITSLCAMFHSLWSNREKAVKARFSGHDKRLESLEKRVDKHTEQLPSMVLKLANHEKILAKHQGALTAIESELKHLPKTSDLKEIYERIEKVSTQLVDLKGDMGKELSDLKGDMGKVSGAMPGIVHTTEMMNEFLLNQGR